MRKLFENSLKRFSRQKVSFQSYQNGWCNVYSQARIAECVDSYDFFVLTQGKEPTVTEFVEISKIGKRELAIKILHYVKYSLSLNKDKECHGCKGALSIIDSSKSIWLDLCCFYLSWRSRPLRYYKAEIKQLHRVELGSGTMSR